MILTVELHSHVQKTSAEFGVCHFCGCVITFLCPWSFILIISWNLILYWPVRNMRRVKTILWWCWSSKHEEKICNFWCTFFKNVMATSMFWNRTLTEYQSIYKWHANISIKYHSTILVWSLYTKSREVLLVHPCLNAFKSFCSYNPSPSVILLSSWRCFTAKMKREEAIGNPFSSSNSVLALHLHETIYSWVKSWRVSTWQWYLPVFPSDLVSVLV